MRNRLARIIKRYDDWCLCLCYKIEYLKKVARQPECRRTLLFYPERPGLFSTIYQLCYLQGVRISTNARASFDACIYWKDATHREPDATVHQIAQGRGMINAGCIDISKQRVDAAHVRAFGYGMAVDPLHFSGPCVRKSDTNATHDGVVIQCPLCPCDVETARAGGSVFMKLINNVVCCPNDRLPGPPGNYVQEFRVPYFGGMIPLCYRKYRPVVDRFDSHNTLVDLVNTEDAFSTSEVRQIISFCEDMGLDYGELDVLRDVDDGRIYVIDANATPCGPPWETAVADEIESFRRMGAALVTAFLS